MNFQSALDKTGFRAFAKSGFSHHLLFLVYILVDTNRLKPERMRATLFECAHSHMSPTHDHAGWPLYALTTDIYHMCMPGCTCRRIHARATDARIYARVSICVRP